MLQQIQARFAASGQTPKGRRALEAIFRGTLSVVTELGLSAASLEAIADQAGLSQAALRHYFPTRDDLLTAFFLAATGWLESEVRSLAGQNGVSPRDQLEQCVNWHLQYMEQVDTAFWLESSAYWLRNPEGRRARDRFYRWLAGQYARLIGQIQPTLNPRECQRRAVALLTLVVGAWITHGRGSATDFPGTAAERRQLLVDTALDIATQ